MKTTVKASTYTTCALIVINVLELSKAEGFGCKFWFTLKTRGGEVTMLITHLICKLNVLHSTLRNEDGVAVHTQVPRFASDLHEQTQGPYSIAITCWSYIRMKMFVNRMMMTMLVEMIVSTANLWVIRGIYLHLLHLLKMQKLATNVRHFLLFT